MFTWRRSFRPLFKSISVEIRFMDASRAVLSAPKARRHISNGYHHSVGKASGVCSYASSAGTEPAVETVGYSEVERVSAAPDPACLLVDVREPDELAQHGHIPSAINIPLGNVEATLGAMSPAQFESTYGRCKPGPDTRIIFYCQVGRRSHLATVQALQLGYHRSKNYLGSFAEWASKKQPSQC